MAGTNSASKSRCGSRNERDLHEMMDGHWRAQGVSRRQLPGRSPLGRIGNNQKGMRLLALTLPPQPESARAWRTGNYWTVYVPGGRTVCFSPHPTPDLHKGMQEDLRGQAMTGICTKMSQVFGNAPAHGLDALWRDAPSARIGRFRATDRHQRQRGTGAGHDAGRQEHDLARHFRGVAQT
jgi:hypothetical protein